METPSLARQAAVRLPGALESLMYRLLPPPPEEDTIAILSAIAGSVTIDQDAVTFFVNPAEADRPAKVRHLELAKCSTERFPVL